MAVVALDQEEDLEVATLVDKVRSASRVMDWAVAMEDKASEDLEDLVREDTDKEVTAKEATAVKDLEDLATEAKGSVLEVMAVKGLEDLAMEDRDSAPEVTVQVALAVDKDSEAQVDSEPLTTMDDQPSMSTRQPRRAKKERWKGNPIRS